MSTTRQLTDEKTRKEVVEEFSDLMVHGQAYRIPFLRFPLVCRWLHVDREQMDRVLISEFGYSGAQILKILKYGRSFR